MTAFNGFEALSALSQEFLLLCDREGKLLDLDPRAERVLGLKAGGALRPLLVPGTEDKLDDLLASTAEVRGWELSLVLGGAPVVVNFSARPMQQGLALLGSVVPESVSATLAQLQESMQEVVTLNREVARQKNEISRRADELAKLNLEMEESTRGILALHAELEDKSHVLRRDSDVKARLVSTVSHEFRTPVNSILGLAQLLADGADGPLNDEQVQQVRFIKKSAETLSTLINDLLDLSKLEAGRLTVRTTRFTVDDLFGSLRGTLRPLVPADSKVALEFDIEAGLPPLETDDGKVAQILRNLVSNAIKFTEKGEVRVTAARTAGDTVTFSVRDTGIGIAPGDQDKIFEEFSQIDSPIQRKVKGTGLGLPLSRKLAALLGGSLTVTSAPGHGSTFSLTLPLVNAEVRAVAEMVERAQRPGAGQPILVVEDDRQTLFLYEKYLSRAGFQVVPARTTERARELMKTIRPAAIVLDVMLEGESTWAFLSEVKGNPQTSDIPVSVVTVTSREHKARALGADEFWLKPIDGEKLLRRLQALVRPGHAVKVLMIDDDPTARYVMKKLLASTPYVFLEAANGPEGVAIAQKEQPQLIILDFVLHDLTAFDVLDDLKTNLVTRNIPVIINTSKDLTREEQQRLQAETTAILSKQALSRELAIARVKEALEKAGVSRSAEG